MVFPEAFGTIVLCYTPFELIFYKLKLLYCRSETCNETYPHLNTLSDSRHRRPASRLADQPPASHRDSPEGKGDRRPRGGLQPHGRRELQGRGPRGFQCRGTSWARGFLHRVGLVPSEDSFIINFVLTKKMPELFEFTSQSSHLKYRFNCDELPEKSNYFRLET